MIVQKYRVMKILPNQWGNVIGLGLTVVGPGQVIIADCDSLKEAESFIDDAVYNSGKLIPHSDEYGKPAYYETADYKDFYIIPVYVSIKEY